jgi:putative addiction module killer protein
MEYRYEVRQTDRFADWYRSLRDTRARKRIQARIDLLGLGNAGDCKAVGFGVYEMRIHFGPGYRVYFMRRAKTVYVLLAGGDKRSQKRDIAAAIELAKYEQE